MASEPERARAVLTAERIVGLGAVLAAAAVVLGAFAAHGLKARLSPEALAIFETGLRYHLYHALALVLLGTFALGAGGTTGGGLPAATTASFWCFLFGIVVFSGSLYVLSLSGLRWLGAVTPLGGLAFIVGWLCLAWAAWRG